jgi:CHASE3 domain sensor protein
MSTENAPPGMKRIITLLLASLFAIAAAVGSIWWSTQRLADGFRWVDHTHEVMYELQVALVHAVSIQSGARGFSLTGEPRYLAPYVMGLVAIQQSIARLRALTVDNTRQQNRLVRLASLVDEEVAIMQLRLEARRNGGLAAAGAVTADGRGLQVVDAIRGVIAGMQDEEKTLLEQRSRAARDAGWHALWLFAGISAGAAGLIFAAIRSLRVTPAYSLTKVGA